LENKIEDTQKIKEENEIQEVKKINQINKLNQEMDIDDIPLSLLQKKF